MWFFFLSALFSLTYSSNGWKSGPANMSRSADQRAENDFSAGRYFDDHATIAVYSRENSEDTNSSIEKSAQSTLTHGSDISCSTKYPAFTGVSDQKSPVSSPREYPIWKKRLILLVITFAGSM